MPPKFITVLAKRKKVGSTRSDSAPADEILLGTCKEVTVRAKRAFAGWQERDSPRSLIKLAGEVFAQSNLLILRSAALKAEPTAARQKGAEETLATLLPLTEKLERELAQAEG